MSLANLEATCATLDAQRIPYRLQTSPHTGRLSVYTQNIAEAMVPAGTAVDTAAVATNITSSLSSQNVDGYCDNVSYFGMALSDTYYPTVWLATGTTAEGELATLDTEGNLIAPAIIAVIILVAIAVIAASAVYLFCYLNSNSYTYYDPTSQTYDTIVGAAKFLSTVNSKYWYVCAKDGYAVGSRSKYASPSDVPASEVQLWTEHCKNATDIITPNINNIGMNIITWIIIAAVAIGGIYIAAKVLPSALASKGAP
jgi:hypothetical protein